MFQFGKEPTPPPYEFNVGENTFRKITKQEAHNMVLEHFGDRKLFQPKPVQPQTPYCPKGDTLEVPNIDIEALSPPPKPVMPDLGINISSITVNNPQPEVPEFIQGSSNIQARVDIDIADVVPLDDKDSQGKNGGKNLNVFKLIMVENSLEMSSKHILKIMEFKCVTQLLIYINSKEESNIQFVLLQKKQKNSAIMLPYHNLGGSL
uniref:Uncharacterized protein n=1 Tax=Moniliophthora roreri TaxID=221103 RepID=A0A0W0FB84_MONRR